MENLYFALFSHCIPVMGAKRSIICDLQCGTYYFIPNDMYSLLKQHRTLNISSLVEFWGEENRESLESYIELLVKNKSGFSFADLEVINLFPELNMEFEQPSVIDNAIIDFDNNLNNFLSIFSQLESLGCRAILIRILTKISIIETVEMLKVFETSCVQHIDLIFSNGLDLPDAELQSLFQHHFRLSNICVFCSNIDEVIEVKISDKNIEKLGTINKISNYFSPEAHCPSISLNTFVLNLPHFIESLNSNNCLNKKVAVDLFGNVRNCPSMSKIYGNLHRDSLAEIVNISDFKKLWSVKKDDIKVCRDCEFRYICSDCRAHVELGGDFFSKPISCKYDPYTAQWLD